MRDELIFAEDLAVDAGNFLLKHLGKVKRISYKGRVNLLTDVDTKSEALIINRIRRAFPSHKVLSEERGIKGNKSSPYCWLIDPLDGTTNYAHGFPFFAVSIALAKEDIPIVGVVYDPVRKELFSALKEGGAYLNHKKIKISVIRSLKRSLLTTGFPYRFGSSMRRNFEYFIRFIMKSQAVRRPGSAALDLCYVASGRLEGFWELELHPWDTAAGMLIVQEAGGKVTNFRGEPFHIFMKEIVASNSWVHKQMLKVLI